MASLLTLKRGFLANKKENKANTAQRTIATSLGQRQVTLDLLWAHGRPGPLQGETPTLLPTTLCLTYWRGDCPRMPSQLFPPGFQHLNVCLPAKLINRFF